MNNPTDRANLIHWEKHSLRCLVAFCYFAHVRPGWCDEYYVSCRFKQEELSTLFIAHAVPFNRFRARRGFML